MDKRGLLTFALCFLVLILYYKVVLPIFVPTPTKGEAPATANQPDPPPQTDPSEDPTTIAQAPPAPKPADTQPTKPEPAKPVEPIKVVEPEPKPEIPIQDNIVVETALYRTVWTNRGGALKELVLKGFKDLDRKGLLQVIGPIRDPASVPASGHTPDRSSLALDLHSFELQDAQIDYALERQPYAVHLAADGSQLQFSTRLFADAERTQPVSITKTFTFSPDHYHIDVTVEVANLSQQVHFWLRQQSLASMQAEGLPNQLGKKLTPVVGQRFPSTTALRSHIAKLLSPQELTDHAALILRYVSTLDIEPVYTLSAGTGIAAEDQVRPRLEALAGKAKGKGEINIVRKMAMKLDKEPFSIVRQTWDVRWAGIANKYFAAALVADQHTFKQISQATLWGPIDAGKLKELEEQPRLRKDKARALATNVGAALRMEMQAMGPGERQQHRFRYFVGPKSQGVLASYPELMHLPGFGWFAAIARLLVGLLGGCYAIVKNYGIAIIILTLIVRLCMHPLSRKSQMSMHHMQKLQPKIAELREKHKNNKRKQSEEQMKLFRDHGVNPMSGCLPMFLQLPIFIALYRGLDLSVELRQAPFMLWINDLSRPDVLCPLPFALPLVGWTALHVLPLAKTATMVIQQRMMPKSTDPQQQQQQKMMMFMPVMFLFIMYRMPSGLTLYWFTSTLLGILEQKLIKAKLAKMD